MPFFECERKHLSIPHLINPVHFIDPLPLIRQRKKQKIQKLLFNVIVTNY